MKNKQIPKNGDTILIDVEGTELEVQVVKDWNDKSSNTVYFKSKVTMVESITIAPDQLIKIL